MAQNSSTFALKWKPSNVRGAFHFDLSGIPSGATIVSAILSLYSPTDPAPETLLRLIQAATILFSYVKYQLTGQQVALAGKPNRQQAAFTRFQYRIPPFRFLI